MFTQRYILIFYFTSLTQGFGLDPTKPTGRK